MTKIEKANQVAAKVVGFCILTERQGHSAKITMGMALGAASDLGYIAGSERGDDFTLRTLRQAVRSLCKDAGRSDLIDAERF